MSVKEQIFSAADDCGETVAVPEWGDGLSLRVRVMSGEDRISWERCSIGDDGKALPNFQENLLVRTLTDAQGERIFSDADAPRLARRNHRVLSRLYKVARRLNLDTDESAKN